MRLAASAWLSQPLAGGFPPWVLSRWTLVTPAIIPAASPDLADSSSKAISAGPAPLTLARTVRVDPVVVLIEKFGFGRYERPGETTFFMDATCVNL